MISAIYHLKNKIRIYNEKNIQTDRKYKYFNNICWLWRRSKNIRILQKSLRRGEAKSRNVQEIGAL